MRGSPAERLVAQFRQTYPTLTTEEIMVKMAVVLLMEATPPAQVKWYGGEFVVIGGPKQDDGVTYKLSVVAATRAQAVRRIMRLLGGLCTDPVRVVQTTEVE